MYKGGFTGKILRLDLTNQKVTEEEVSYDSIVKVDISNNDGKE